MKSGIISFSELGDRWDAGFHLLRKQYEARAAAIQQTLPVEEVLEMLANEDVFSTETLRVLTPLIRGQGDSRAALLKAAQEYPYLAMAIVSEKANEVFQQRREDLARQQASLDRVVSGLGRIEQAVAETNPGVAESIPPFDRTAPFDLAGMGLDPIPHDTLVLLLSQKFVAGVAFLTEDEIIIPVHTDDRAYVADCWRIDYNDWLNAQKSGKTLRAVLDDLVADGNVPVPVLAEDLRQYGKPVGYLELPSHEQNYGQGWR